MIEILYSCHGCGLREAAVSVRYREPGEDVVNWFEKAVMVAITADHLARAPYCREETCDLKIPMPPGSDRIGTPVKQ
jgi:hypothetical protein